MIAAAITLLAEAAPLTIAVANVRNDRGVVRVAVCPKDRFLADTCPWNGVAPAHHGITEVTVSGLPPGNYAVQAFHDENNNDRVDRALFGIPREGVGFSRDARIMLSPPRWRDAMFVHDAEPQRISFSLRYFLGPASPEAWARKHPPR